MTHILQKTTCQADVGTLCVFSCIRITASSEKNRRGHFQSGGKRHEARKPALYLGWVDDSCRDHVAIVAGRGVVSPLRVVALQQLSHDHRPLSASVHRDGVYGGPATSTEGTNKSIKNANRSCALTYARLWFHSRSLRLKTASCLGVPLPLGCPSPIHHVSELR